MTVALWYYQHFALYVDLFDSEEKAAGMALGMSDAGTASVKGVQYETGEFVEFRKWPALIELEERAQAAFAARIKAEMSKPPGPPPRKVEVRSPWGKDKATVWDVDSVPSWVGYQTDKSEVP